MKYSKHLFLLLMLCFSANVFTNDASVNAERWSQRYAIVMSSAPHQLIPIYEDILADIESQDVEFLDLLANKLVVSIDDDDKYAKQANAVVMRILFASKNKRYYSLLKDLDISVRDSKFYRSRDKYLKAARRDSGEQFVAGGVDFEELKNQYIRSALESDIKFSGPESSLEALKPEHSIQDMFDMFGVPQHMISGNRRFTNGIASVKIKRLSYYYKGQGRVVFDYRRRQGWLLYSVSSEPLAFEEVMPYRENADGNNVASDYGLHMAMLLSDRPFAIRRAAEIYAYGEEVKTEMLDLAAEKLINHYQDGDDSEFIDAYSWLCKWLAQRGGPRYQAILAEVASNSNNAKLVKYAQTEIENLEEMPEGTYVKGAISLNDLMEKYPSPYSI